MPATSGRLAAAGFTDVEMAERVVPCGTWPRDRRLKERGRYFLAQAIISGGTESFSIQLFTRRGGYAEEEVRTMLDEVARELRGNRMHLYSYLCVFFFLVCLCLLACFFGKRLLTGWVQLLLRRSQANIIVGDHGIQSVHSVQSVRSTPVHHPSTYLACIVHIQQQHLDPVH